MVGKIQKWVQPHPSTRLSLVKPWFCAQETRAEFSRPNEHMSRNLANVISWSKDTKEIIFSGSTVQREPVFQNYCCFCKESRCYTILNHDQKGSVQILFNAQTNYILMGEQDLKKIFCIILEGISLSAEFDHYQVAHAFRLFYFLHTIIYYS